MRPDGLPMRVPAAGLPERVTIYEVGARDGLQNESVIVPVEVKAEFLGRLAAAGLGVLEATSFVHPKWVPQLADAAELLERLVRVDGVDYPVLVPNERGLDRALAAGVEHVAIFASATESFAQRNLNRSLDEQFAMFEPVVRRALAAGLRVRGYVSMCFGDPWEGVVAAEQVAAVGGGWSGSAARSSRSATPSVPGPPVTSPRCWMPAWRPACRCRASRCTSTTPTVRHWPTPSPRSAAG